MNILQRILSHTFLVSRYGEQVLAVPTIVLVLLGIISIGLLAIPLIVGLFLEYKYSFE